MVAVATTNSPSRFRRPSGATLATERLPRRLDSEVLDEEEEVQEAIVASLLDSEASQADVCPTASLIVNIIIVEGCLSWSCWGSICVQFFFWIGIKQGYIGEEENPS